MFSLVLLSVNAAQASVLVFEGEETSQAGYDALLASPDGEYLYALDAAGGQVDRFAVLDDGALSTAVPFTQAGMSGATALAFNQDAGFVFLSNNGAADGVGGVGGLYAFLRNDSGGLDVAHFQAGTAVEEDFLLDNYDIRALVVASSGEQIYATGFDSTAQPVVITITGVAFEPSNQRVKYTAVDVIAPAPVNLEVPVKMALSGGVGNVSQRNLYILSDSVAGDDALIHFSRDANSGSLTYVTSFVANSNGLVGFAGLADLTVTSGFTKTTLYIAASEGDAIFQFEQGNEDTSLVLVRVYKEGVDDLTGLDGVSALLQVASNGAIYALSSTGLSNGRITPFYVDDGYLRAVQNEAPVAQGVVQDSVTISGLAGAHALAMANTRENLYVVGPAAAGNTGIARFSRASDLSLDVVSLNVGTLQPGRLAEYTVTLSNNGNADAPGVQLAVSTTHPLVRISGDDAGLCEATLTSGGSSITCNAVVLEAEDSLTVNFALRTSGVSTVTLSASAASRNEISGLDSSVSDSAETKVGEFKNGTLALGAGLQLALLMVYLWRRRSAGLSA